MILIKNKVANINLAVLNGFDCYYDRTKAVDGLLKNKWQENIFFYQ